MIRAVARLGVAVTLATVTGAWLVAAQQQNPQLVFRGGANLVTVDAYPRRDGRVVEGLGPSDFELTEDGVPQAIDQFEFVRVEPAPESARVDPNNQRDMLQQAADPHNRVFVTYLDVYHVQVTGSHDIRRPLVDMLNRILAPNDLFGVTTSKITPKSLVLGRKMLSVEEQLSRYWPWGQRDRIGRDPDDAKEDYLSRCFDKGQVGERRPHADDEGVSRVISDILIDRRREESTLENLRELVSYVGTFREARTMLVLVTDGWRLFRPDPALQAAALKAAADDRQGAPPSPVPPIGTNQSGKLSTAVGMTPYSGDMACQSELARLTALDHPLVFRDIIALANQKNVTFYPVNPSGLELFDSTLERTGEPPVASMNRHNARVDSARTLAENTDGIAVVGTNDLRAGLARIVNDVSAYYLMGYYSTNAKADGKYRQIKVRVKQPKIEVAARRGYVATTAAALERSTAAANASGTDVSAALGQLSRFGGPGTDLFTYGVVADGDLIVIGEIASGQVELGKWRDGGTMKVTITGPAGEQIGTVSGQIDAGARAAMVRIPRGAGRGPWRVGVSVVGPAGSLDDRFDIRLGNERLLLEPILYRATGVARGAVLRPVAEFQYRRTERVHVEWPILKPLDQRSARVLDRRGQPIPVVAPTLSERDDSGRQLLVADLNLANLSPGDFVLELTVAGGGENQVRQIAFRVVR